MKRRTFTKEEKLQILKEAEENGVQLTLRKHGIYNSTYYNWRKRYKSEGEAGISDTATRRHDRQRMEQLEDEVSLLKQMLAEREMQIALQDELIKKKYPKARRRQ
jgi:putative transposase